MYLNSVSDLRATFASLLAAQKFTTVNREATMTALTGGSTIEVVGANFLASEDAIFGEVNWDYVRREEAWYNSQSLNVNDIPGGPPQVWKAVADKDGFINSNYGWCIHASDNGWQYDNAVAELKKNPESRRAVMIYTRPEMWTDYNKNGRSDFMCLAGDTIVKSPEGDLPIQQVVEKIKEHGKWPVWSVDFKTGVRRLSWATDGAMTGTKEIVRVHLDDGTHVDCTEDHVWFIQNKIGGTWNYGVEVKAMDLQPGTRLVDLMMHKIGNSLATKRTLSGEFTFDMRESVHRQYYQFATGEELGDDVIHHKNGDPTDNRLSNLQRMASTELRAHRLKTDSPAHKMDNQVEERSISWYEQRSGATLDEALNHAREWFSNTFSASLRKYRTYLQEIKKQRYMTIISWASKKMGIHPLKLIYQNTKVVRVERLNISVPVYDITVPGDHNYFIGNGVLVHNCTNAVQYLIRDGRAHAVVQMRSNDAVFGYKNDRAWQQHVLERVASDVGVPPGDIIWNVGSIHVYARHFYLVHHFGETGELNITKAKYDELYPDSPYRRV